MDQEEIKQISKKHAPKQHYIKNEIIAFLSGGTLAAVAQIVMMGIQKYFNIDKQMATSIIVVTVILITAILTGLGVYDKLAQHCGAGLFIPISGFANSLTACAIEGKSEGPIYGIGSNMFRLAGSVFTYGIASAFVFGLIRYLLFGG